MSAILPTITTSTRDVTNKDTGLDLYVHGEQQSVVSKRISKVTIYNVIVVTSLPIFSATKGKTSQYALEKSHDDLQRLNKRLCKRFSGTLIPEVPKKPVSLMDNPAKARERVRQCESFLQFCAKTPKIVNSEELLQFLALSNANRSSPKDVDDQAQKNNQKDTAESNDKCITQPKLFEDAIAITDQQIFNIDDGEDELSDFIGLKSDDRKNPYINSNQPLARLYKEFSPSNVNWSVKTQNDEAITNEQETVSNDSGDDLEDLTRRLDGARLHREKREEQRNVRKVQQSADNDISITDDHASPEVGELALEDISKYISENSRTTLDFDLDL